MILNKIFLLCVLRITGHRVVSFSIRSNSRLKVLGRSSVARVLRSASDENFQLSEAVTYFKDTDGNFSWQRISDFFKSTALGQTVGSSSNSPLALDIDGLKNNLDHFVHGWIKHPIPSLDSTTLGLQSIQTYLQTLLENYLSLPPAIQASAVLIPISFTSIIFLYQESFPPYNFRSGYEPYARGQYNPIAAQVYYSKHPRLVLRRMLQLFRISNKFIFNFLVDKYIFRDEEKQRPKRAQEVLALIQRAGPTAIKVGQALSVRPDLIPAEYSEALSTLQDRVPPFPSNKAKDILLKELGPTILSRIKGLDLRETGKGPVASASIGQVYKGVATLRDGTEREVAVKVQRPDVLAEIALDLFIVREFLAPLQQKISGAATDFQSLANEWGRGFIAELDYNQEASNTIKFNTEIQKRNIVSVTAPIVIEELSSERILVTEWIRGKRLDISTESDVPRLCGVALNAYLVMLLEMSFLHCDPHPGNLLRTEDGKLCILDFGMTLETDATLQYSLLEFVAHLTSDSFEQIPEDLVKLGFLKPERLDSVRASGFLQPLVYILKQAKQGGGGSKVRERIYAEYRERFPGLSDEELRFQMRDDMKKRMEQEAKKESAVSGITMEVEELQKRNRDAFKIPEWFLYTSRAFLTLEGIGLQADENYSIIQSCFPYIARRLLGDDSPRAQSALKDLLYGASNILDTNRLSDLADGFTSYTKSTKTIVEKSLKPTGLRDRAETEASITLVKDSADLILSPSGNLVQNLLLSESTLATSASVKDTLRNFIIDGPISFKESLPFNLGSFLPDPPFSNEIKPFLEKTKEEVKAQELLAKLSSIIERQNISSVEPNQTSQLSTFINSLAPEEVALITRELRTNLPKYGPLLANLGNKYARACLQLASDNIENGLGEVRGDDLRAQIVRTAARNLATVASQSADALKSK